MVNDPAFFLSHRISLAQALKAHYQLKVVVPERGDLVQKIREQGFEVITLDLDRSSMNPLGELKTWLAFYKIYRREKPDIVHHFTLKPILYGSLAAHLSGVPRMINTFTGLGFMFTGKSKKKKIAQKIIFKLLQVSFSGEHCDVIFQNRDDRQLFQDSGVLGKCRSSVVLGSGVDAKKYAPLAEQQPHPLRVLFPGRLLRDKGILEFVEAARQLNNGKTEFVVAGKIDEENPAGIKEPVVKSWVDEGVIRWLGHCSDMKAVFDSSDIVCLPSYREGLPLALLEAASCGKPIVSTDVPGCREAVSDGYNGYLVPAQDSKALVTALDKLIESADLRETMGKNGRQQVEQKFTVDKINSQVLEIYRDQPNAH